MEIFSAMTPIGWSFRALRVDRRFHFQEHDDGGPKTRRRNH